MAQFSVGVNTHTIKDKVEAAYHRTDLLEQRRGLMNAWEALVTGKVPEQN